VRRLNFSQVLGVLDTLKAGGYIDRQSRTVVLDAVLFNGETDLFTMVTFTTVFEANGLLTTEVELYNLK
jgi:hypothetical protein